VIEALYQVMEWEPARLEQTTPRARAGAEPPSGPGVRRLGEARVAMERAELGLDDDAADAMVGGPVELAHAAAASDLKEAEGAAPCRVFSRSGDRVLAPKELAAPGELTALRQQLDAALGDVRALLAPLASRLQRRLLAQQLRAWDFDLEEGLLDAARLDRVVVDPGSALPFKQERDALFRDTVVTILIDNCGSMRGRKITLAAMTADIVTRALERGGVRTEVLGFTTGGWKGGASAGPGPWPPARHGRAGSTNFCISSRDAAAVRAATRAMPVKADRTDASAIAPMERAGWFRAVHARSQRSQERRALLTARRLSWSASCATSTTACVAFCAALARRWGWSGSGPSRPVPASSPGTGGPPGAGDRAAALQVREALLSQRDRLVIAASRDDKVCRRLMSAPGVGPVTAPTFCPAVDDPARCGRLRAVGAHFGLTPRRCQSGETDRVGQISKRGATAWPGRRSTRWPTCS
jgi:hypothetical protein